ncbi:type IV pilin [Halogeometricum luteum]|uniref:Type IV pilin n=1 Tax=Halogeometricum luteum TaxID=2950537 RepID=A0ABU2G1J8_9EURY|nr:type IV pilin [Halogeometricum sp. S3BR5-2]MDS0294652.1 type IV pilin [Halogeometricum sp. S3BR5-2]
MSPLARTTDRGVSPRSRGTLMLLVVVLLAAVLGGIAFGFQDFLVEPGPRVAFDVEYHADGSTSTLREIPIPREPVSKSADC